MNRLFPSLILLVTALVGCTSQDRNRPADQTFGLGSDSTGTTVNLTGLGKHEVVQYFKTREGLQCYEAFGEYFKFKAKEASAGSGAPNESQLSTDQFAIREAFSAIKDIAINSSDNMRDVALAAHGFQPTGVAEDDMLAAMKSTCTTYGYFDWKRDQDTHQYAFWTAFQGNFWKTAKVLGVGYLASDTAKHALDAAATKYDVGGNLTQVGGNQDNTQNQAGGTCAGTVVDGTCVSPTEEVLPDEGSESPDVEEPAVNPVDTL